MTNMPATHTSSDTQSVRVLRWIFERNHAAITCEVDMRDDGAYDVCVVPHWDVSASIVERFTRPIGAFERHAELARGLREAGWVSRHGAQALRTVGA